MSEQSQKLDVLIVGTGMAGLVAGSILSARGLKVGLFDKHSKLGGYAQYFGVDVCWDATTHFFGGMAPGGWIHDALAPIGLLELLPLLPLEPAYRLVLPGGERLVSSDPVQFQESLAQAFPEEADGLARFFTDVDVIGRQYPALSQGVVEEGPLADNADRTAADFIADYTKNAELAEVLGGTWMFTGLPPSRLSALHFAMQFHALHLQGGAVTARGGLRHLTAVMGEFITAHGGTIENRMPVKRLLTGANRVLGAELDDGRRFHTRAVLSTVNPHDTFEKLLAGEGRSPAAYPPLGQFITSVSSICVHLLTSAKIDAPARVTLAQWSDADAVWRDLQRANPEFEGLAISILDHGDAERAPAGQHMVSIATLAPYTVEHQWHVPWKQRRTREYRRLPEYLAHKEAVGDRLVARAAELLPGIDAPTKYRRVATPITLERYTYNTAGAAFGWANLPEQSGSNRPGWRSPLEGLYLAGHWTFPGAGIAPVALSARLAAEAILADK